MRVALIPLLFLFTVSCFSQGRERLKESSFDPTTFKEFPVEITKVKKNDLVTVHFKTATFIDMRPDSSKIGFILAGATTDEYHRVVFPKPAATYLTEKASSFLIAGDSATGNITFVIKQLWVSEAMVKAKSVVKRLVASDIDYLSFCYLDVDCYLNKDGSYRYLGCIDTVYSLRRWIVEKADDLLKKSLVETIKKSDTLLTGNQMTGSLINKETLLQKYQSDFDLPILKTAQPQKGVFATYQDFISNNPSVRNFEVVKEKKTEWLKSPEASDSLLNNSWGYYDGGDFNIHINDNYYRLVRSQNTFELAGPRTVTKIYGTSDKIFAASLSAFFGNFISAGLELLLMGSTNKIMKELVPYQLDIRDGLLH